MVSKPIEFLFDLGSPNAYLVHRVIPAIEARSGVRFAYVPILIGGIFKATGNQSPATAYAHIANKMAYGRREIERFVAAYDLEPFAMTPYFPINTLLLMRGAIAAQRLGVFDRYVDAVFGLIWRDHAAMGDPAVVHDMLTATGLPADELIALTQDPAVKAELIANTDRAVARGAFGAPTFFVGDEMWFGKETLRDVVDAAQR